MGMVKAVLEHPEDLIPLTKMMMTAEQIKRQIPPEPHWGFAYSMLQKVSRSFALVIQQLDADLRNAVCIFYLVLRALDTVEDDTSIPVDIKVPILLEFHKHIYDRDWHFSCGTNAYKVLMDKFHFISIAFSELETVDDYDEYCHYVAGLVGLGLSKLFHASKLENEAPDSLSNSMGLFLQKTNIIRDFLEDINEMPKSRMFWPWQIWNKYANKLEDLKYEENSVKAVQCLNDMVTNALVHAEDCLKYLSNLKTHAIFRFCAIPQIMAIGTLALCYGNEEVFRGVVKMRRGKKRIEIDEKDPNAILTRKRVEAIKKACVSTGLLNKRGLYVVRKRAMYSSVLIMVVVLLLAIFSAAPLMKW
ncbi:hypothetical protein KFK09_006557 [Dendrobium nobile]|uniref:Squalene synthase n=1 Tax=Dendrobium nobile TaxID=94219 RepID=A0A8T3BTW3_DENNO|nr:hypothetical protein KFK09_006557 [Dendrobium nobile]